MELFTPKGTLLPEGSKEPAPHSTQSPQRGVAVIRRMHDRIFPTGAFELLVNPRDSSLLFSA